MSTPGIVYPALDAEGKSLVKSAGLQSRTYGRYGVPTDAFDVPAASTVRRWKKIPFDIDIIEGTIYLSGIETGDSVRFIAAPETPLNALVVPGQMIPILTSPISANDKSIFIIPALLEAVVDQALIDVGWWEIQLCDGINAPTSPVLVIDYDRATGEIKLGKIKHWEGGANNEPPDWEGFADPWPQDTIVLVTRVLIDLIEIAEANLPISFGRAANGAAPIPANIPLCLDYTNNSQNVNKRIRWSLDVLSGKPIQEGG